ncbi:MAG TPA: fibronectin type III domain-containing protein, partial [Solirubrobacterales bacterium]|nr:fibronectin type III domain-containing protein [Solirubrobacterales bacterium]
MRVVASRGTRKGSRQRGSRAGRLAFCGALASLLLAVCAPAAGAFAPLLGPVSATPTTNGSTLKATVYPYGLDTHYRFEYGTTTAYGTSVPAPDGDAGSAAYPTAVPVQETISGLAPNTAYHYRFAASNSDGPVSSADLQFTTTGPAPTVSDEA